jgi:RNA polymerase sigma factor (sigma-70 family)
LAIDVRQHAAADDATSAHDVASMYELYAGRILAYCIHALGSRSEAEDAVQTTFLQAHRALQRGVTPTHEFAWLHTIAKNVCRTQRRAATRRAAVTGMDLDALPASHSDGDEADVLVGLRDALASIPERQRRALLLREWHGLSSEEVASRLGMSAPATYALLTRARRSLAHALTAPRRSTLGLNLGALLFKLKAFLGGAGVKVAAGTAVAVVAVGGGVAVERSVIERSTPSSDVSREVSADASSDASATRSSPVSARASLSIEQTRSKEAARLAAERGAGGEAVSRPSASGGPSGRVVDLPTLSPTPAPETPPESPPADRSTDEKAPPEKTLRDALPQVPLPEIEIEVEVDLDPATELLPEEPLPPLPPLSPVDTGTVTDPLPSLPVPPLPPLP